MFTIKYEWVTPPEGETWLAKLKPLNDEAVFVVQVNVTRWYDCTQAEQAFLVGHEACHAYMEWSKYDGMQS